MAVELRLGARVTLRKRHPCGGAEWRVERMGADVGIRCLTCGHYVLTPRRKLEHAAKSGAPPASQAAG